MTNPTPHGQVPEALRIADEFRECLEWDTIPSIIDIEDAADELRRLHAENEALRTQQDDAYDHGPQAETVEEAARDVGKWLNERPNRPLDLRHVAMLTHHAKRTQQPAPEYVGNGMFNGETIEKAAEHWANWCDRRCMNGLAEFLRVVAARAQADSLTAPAATPTAASIAWSALRDLTDPLGEAGVKIMGHVRIYAQRQYEAGLAEGSVDRAPADSVPPMTETGTGPKPVTDADVRNMSARVISGQVEEDELLEFFARLAPPHPVHIAAPTQPAQAADSVLEDAARLDWLALAGPTSICLVIDRPHDGEIEVATDDVTGYGQTLREALDAARKQGGKP